MDSFGDIAKAIAPVATVVSSIGGFLNKPAKAPDLKLPVAAPTQVMPTPDDASAKAAALKAIALRASQHGRQSTDLTNKTGKLGA